MSLSKEHDASGTFVAPRKQSAQGDVAAQNAGPSSTNHPQKFKIFRKNPCREIFWISILLLPCLLWTGYVTLWDRMAPRFQQVAYVVLPVLVLLCLWYLIYKYLPHENWYRFSQTTSAITLFMTAWAGGFWMSMISLRWIIASNIIISELWAQEIGLWLIGGWCLLFSWGSVAKQFPNIYLQLNKMRPQLEKKGTPHLILYYRAFGKGSETPKQTITSLINMSSLWERLSGQNKSNELDD